ncbi:hypothetical protein M011DRAFT_457646 [Sporormia fimetaria CBS 119925]|uniref:Uncharacterized protein n=1 Tax=Sporormia fimetaria CBS 119925 TaxID=1340428 RepID=A0A6A6VES4_9PLEO|nr:hypothetical protein M011DRAFT_457646 [Sporormia fimetaria CBS 119925]
MWRADQDIWVEGERLIEKRSVVCWDRGICGMSIAGCRGTYYSKAHQPTLRIPLGSRNRFMQVYLPFIVPGMHKSTVAPTCAAAFASSRTNPAQPCAISRSSWQNPTTKAASDHQPRREANPRTWILEPAYGSISSVLVNERLGAPWRLPSRTEAICHGGLSILGLGTRSLFKVGKGGVWGHSRNQHLRALDKNLKNPASSSDFSTSISAAPTNEAKSQPWVRSVRTVSYCC